MTQPRNGRSTKIRVLIVDDHPLFRAGLEKALSMEEDMIVVGHGPDGEQALSLVHELHPDVVLLDVNLPGQNGIQVAHRLKRERSEVAIVFLTAYHDTYQVLLAMRVGAAAFCEKNIHPDDLVEVIRTAAAGHYIVNGERMDSNGVAAWIHKNVYDIVGPYSDDPDKHFVPLSKRETEILESITLGMSNKEVASELGISQQTVKNHMTSILRKLNVEDRTQAAVMALRHGWVRIQDKDMP
jgi:DNA-binding NarL/FixJ family response regulator